MQVRVIGIDVKYIYDWLSDITPTFTSSYDLTTKQTGCKTIKVCFADLSKLEPFSDSRS